jgi:hypothetical protein
MWAQLAQVGSFGGVAVNSANSAQQERPTHEPKPASSKAASQPSANPLPEPSTTPGSDLHAIPFGQSVSAVLETTIAWEGSRGSRTSPTPNDRYFVTLNQPLNNRFGNPEIPAGSQLAVRLDSKGQALVTLTVESAIIGGVEMSLPPGARANASKFC